MYYFFSVQNRGRTTLQRHCEACYFFVAARYVCCSVLRTRKLNLRIAIFFSIYISLTGIVTDLSTLSKLGDSTVIREEARDSMTSTHKRLVRLGGALGGSALSVRGRPPPAQLLGFLGLLLTLGQDLGVLSGGLAVLLPGPPLEGGAVALPLQHGGSHQALDLGRLEGGGLALLGRKRPLDDVLPDVISLAQVEELADVRGPLGSQPPGDGVVGQSGDLGVALLDDGQGQD